MAKWTIQRQVVLLALVPAALVAAILTLYQAWARVGALEASVLERARAVADHAATPGEPSLAERDPEALRGLAEASLGEHPALERVVILGPNGAALARAQRGGFDASALDADTGAFHTVTHPIVPRTASAPTQAGAEAHEAAPVGEIELVIDARAIRERQWTVLAQSLAVSLAALAVVGALAIQIGRRVTRPMRRINEAVARVRQGQPSVPRVRSAGDEPGSLERSINEMARAVEDQHSTLQARVDHKTAELESTLQELEKRNAELEELHLEAQAASEFKSRFLANISHEIRTPMNSIVGFAELLERADLDTVEADYLENIRESARSLLGLLNGILDLSKIESGRMELEHVETDLNAIVVEVFHLFGPHAMRKGVELLVPPVPEHINWVYTDPLRLKQVLINLVSNAVKFTEEGYVELAVTGSIGDDGHVELRFSVADTGSGIPESAQTRLFQAFAQGRPRGDTRGNPDQVGTGLGLHIASEIVFLMDGSIEFSSEPGFGTTFWFGATFERADHVAIDQRSRARQKLLFVDDDDRSRPVYTRVLQRAGYQIEACAASSAGSSAGVADAIVVHVPAASVFAGELPDPVTDGTARVRPQCALAHAPNPGVREQLRRAGFDEVIPKTPDITVINRALQAALGATAEDQANARGERPCSSLPTGLRVLIIDDHPVNRRLFASYLEDENGEAVAVGASDEALYYIGTQRFDAVLLDIHLPDRDGIATAEAIRSSDTANALIPIIAITADAFQDQNERAMEAGINELLIKPVTRAELRGVLAMWYCDARAGPLWDDPPASPDQGAPFAHDDGASHQPQPVYDRAEAVRRAAGREDVAAELFAVLQRSLPETRERLVDAMQSQNADAVRATAHSLRGAAAYCGVPRLEAAVTSVEQEAQRGTWEGLTRALDELLRAIDEIAELAAPQPDPDRACR